MGRWCLLVLLLLGGCSSSTDRLDQLAKAGNIQQDAPVRASVEINVHASPEKIWGLLTDINGWPKWNHAVEKAAVSGPIANGTTFTWKAGGTEIHSRIALVEPVRQFGWTGKAYGARAIHIWHLTPLPDGQTLVKTDESMSGGVLLTLFYSSSKLEETDRAALQDLKTAAQQ